ncbi:hypothetical protein Pint_07572 [Pistacia integerrima]|uniref:Uncharacterized protein n=1 Tax=Pistacia integerrima TaxID=434235 RepID=A0ACC0XUA6_9ROSI|nr:hypothetical protein Pint_07572 [Pistacia integerrima]
MSVVKGIAYERFMEDLHRTINVDANKCSLAIEVLLPCINMSAPPMRICDYPTLCFFLDNAGGPASGFIPLCITEYAISLRRAKPKPIG